MQVCVLDVRRSDERTRQFVHRHEQLGKLGKLAVPATECLQISPSLI